MAGMLLSRKGLLIQRSRVSKYNEVISTAIAILYNHFDLIQDYIWRAVSIAVQYKSDFKPTQELWQPNVSTFMYCITLNLITNHKDNKKQNQNNNNNKKGWSTIKKQEGKKWKCNANWKKMFKTPGILISLKCSGNSAMLS